MWQTFRVERFVQRGRISVASEAIFKQCEDWVEILRRLSDEIGFDLVTAPLRNKINILNSIRYEQSGWIFSRNSAP